MKTVEGVKISGYDDLAKNLESYCKISSAAQNHLIAASKVGATIEVQNTGNICHAERTVVKVSIDSCLDKITGQPSMIYLTESVLFELQNAINFNQYQTIKKNTLNGLISVLQYGLGFSNLEFESTVKTVQILTQLKGAGHPISPWGEKQFPGYAMGPNNFANQPHDPNSTGEKLLPSKLFYAYSYLEDTVKEVKNMKIKALKKLAIIKKGQKPIDSLKWGQLTYNWGTNAHLNKSPALFLVSYIDALLWLGNEMGWSVIWEGGTMTDWKLCATEFVRTVPNVQHDRTATETIKKSIELEM